MGRLGIVDCNGHSPSITCHPLTTVHLLCTTGALYSYASSVFGYLELMPGQKDSGHGFPWSGRRTTVAHMAQIWQGEGKEEEGQAGRHVPRLIGTTVA